MIQAYGEQCDECGYVGVVARLSSDDPDEPAHVCARCLVEAVAAITATARDYDRAKGSRPGSTYCPACGDHTCGLPDGPAKLTRCGHTVCPRCRADGLPTA